MLWLLFLAALVWAECPTKGTVYFATGNDGCKRSHGNGHDNGNGQGHAHGRPISLEVEFGRCYPAHYDCGGDPACVIGGDLESIFTCGGCEPTESFRIQDGVLEMFTTSTDCTGRRHMTDGCLFGVISAGGLKQFDATDAVAASDCP